MFKTIFKMFIFIISFISTNMLQADKKSDSQHIHATDCVGRRGLTSIHKLCIPEDTCLITNLTSGDRKGSHEEINEKSMFNPVRLS